MVDHNKTSQLTKARLRSHAELDLLNQCKDELIQKLLFQNF